MLEIEVMYADLDGAGAWLGTRSRTRVPIGDVATLSRVGVLFMIVSGETTPAMGRRTVGGVPVRRVRELYGYDHYAYMPHTDGAEPFLIIWGWDDKNFQWVRLADPFDTKLIADPHRPEWEAKLSWPPWLPLTALTFEGFQLPSNDWDAAVADFNATMH